MITTTTGTLEITKTEANGILFVEHHQRTGEVHRFLVSELEAIKLAERLLFVCSPPIATSWPKPYPAVVNGKLVGDGRD